MSNQSRPIPCPPLRNPRYHSLDVWRGVACLTVVVSHTTFYAAPGGALAAAAQLGVVGVPVFFVISGYCVIATADSTRRTGRTLDYFRRRLRRIFPPYWVCLAATAALVWLAAAVGFPSLFGAPPHPIPEQPPTPARWIGNITLIEAWRPHLGGPEKGWYLGPAWTLAYEEQFYAVCGLLLLGRRLFAGAAVVTAGCLLSTVLFHLVSLWNVDGFFFDGHWLLFAAGIAVYHGLNRASPGGAHVLVLVLTVGLATAIYLRLGPSHPFLVRPRLLRIHAEEWIFGLEFALLVWVLRPWDRALAGSRLLASVRWCGQRSYSIYLVHWPVVRVVSRTAGAWIHGPAETLLLITPLCLTASIAVGWLFYLAVERHFLNAPQTPAPSRGQAG